MYETDTHWPNPYIAPHEPRTRKIACFYPNREGAIMYQATMIHTKRYYIGRIYMPVNVRYY